MPFFPQPTTISSMQVMPVGDFLNADSDSDIEPTRVAPTTPPSSNVWIYDAHTRKEVRFAPKASRVDVPRGQSDEHDVETERGLPRTLTSVNFPPGIGCGAVDCLVFVYSELGTRCRTSKFDAEGKKGAYRSIAQSNRGGDCKIDEAELASERRIRG